MMEAAHTHCLMEVLFLMAVDSCHNLSSGHNHTVGIVARSLNLCDMTNHSLQG